MNVPQLRFKGFNEEWQSKKLKNVADVIGGGTPNTANNEYWNGNINWFVPSEVINKKYVNTSQRKITNKGLKNSSAKLLPINTILFTSRATIGSMAILKQVATTNQGFQSLVINRDNDVNYIYAMQNIIAKQAKQKAAGSTFLEISNKSVKSINVQVPSLPEQQKIGTFFAKLDKLIELNERKLELLKKKKKGYLQKLFPQAEQTTPQLRFKGFNEEWQSKKLRQLITSEWKGKAQTDNLKAGTVLYLDTNYLNNHNNAFYSNAVCDVNDDDIIILWDGSNAGTIYYHVSGALGSTLKAYRLNKHSNAGFVYQLLKSQQQLIFKRFRTPNIPHVVKDFTNIFKVSIPDLQEQQRIGTLFAKLDHLIELQNHKLELLQELKKGYLQKMFV